MIESIILSKNRACQLDLLLRSIEKNFKEVSKINVLYNSTTEEFSKGYDILKEKFPNVNFIKETNFREDYLKILGIIKSTYFMNFCDDNVVITNDEVQPLLNVYKSNDQIATVSLRLNPKYDFCYPAQQKLQIPTFIKTDPYLMWDWRKSNPHMCWGYPHPVDNNVYKTDYYKTLISRCKLNTPCIEAEINRMRHPEKPYMISLLKTKILTVTNNRTQDWNQNICLDNDEDSLESLNNKFLNGMVIDLKEIEQAFPETTFGHCEHPYRMK